MQVDRIMTVEPVTIQVHASPDDAVLLMDEHDFRHLPVLDGERLVGVISDRDLLTATGWLPPRVQAMQARRFEPGVHTTLKDIVHEPAMAVSPSDSVVTVAVEAVVQSIGCLPVVENDKLVGIVTEMDLVMAYSMAAQNSAISGDNDPPVSRVMSTGVRGIELDTTIDEAIRLCKTQHVRHLPVEYEGRLEGILSDRDLRRAVGVGRQGDYPVSKVMTSDVITVGPKAPLTEVARLMIENKISAIPVVDDESLAGIVTLADMLDFCINHLREPEVRNS